ncbi:hypothetical protein DFH09DRAFT_1094836 [Mycena vulgaris]|nr:hypothetical protein DFH09DRAFT_1094836 [Mycena vulgaris]
MAFEGGTVVDKNFDVVGGASSRLPFSACSVSGPIGPSASFGRLGIEVTARLSRTRRAASMPHHFPQCQRIVVLNTWVQNASLGKIGALSKRFKTQQLPILENLSGPNAGAYSNEADVLETNFQTTFSGHTMRN